MIKKYSLLIFVILIGNSLCSQEQNFIPYRIKSSWGFSDLKGNIQIQPVYDSVEFFNKYNFLGQPLAVVYKNGKKGLIQKGGKIVVPLNYTLIRETQKIEAENYKYMNELLVVSNGKFGLINYQNKVLIPFEYDTLFLINEIEQKKDVCFYLGRKNGDFYKIDSNKKMHLIQGVQYDQYSNNGYSIGDMPVGRNYDETIPSAVISKKQEILAKNTDIADDIGVEIKMDNKYIGRRLTYRKGKVGVCNVKFDSLKLIVELPIIYDEVFYCKFFAGCKCMLYVVKKQNKITVVDRAGKEYMPLRYDTFISWQGEEFIIYRQDNKQGVYNLKTNLNIEPIYDHVQSVVYSKSINLWLAKLNGHKGYIGYDGVKYFKD